jgi:hypothetical protein
MYARDAAIKLTKYTTDNVVAMTNWVSETKETLMNQFLLPWMASLNELALEIEKCFASVNGKRDNFNLNECFFCLIIALF